MEQVKEGRLEDFQKEVLLSVELLWTAAQNKKGRGFNPMQINHIAGYLNSLSVALMQHEQAKQAYDKMLEAYIAQHGREIFDKISGNVQVVEGEVLTDAEFEKTLREVEHAEQETVTPSERDGLDSPSEGKE